MTAISDPAPLRVGLAGLGTVGAGVLKIFVARAEALAASAGRALEIRAVSARNRGKDRGVDLSAFDWEDDPVAMARRSDLDLIVEVIGGADGPAKAAAEAALGRGAHLVTANKALLAHHGLALAALAEETGATLAYEAAVAGGIPIIKALGEGLAANESARVYGVLNGTCNYILTEMERAGRDYADVLAEAQTLGYAEADPTADVGGWDTAHKLSLLAALAFRTKLDFEGVAVEGVERVALDDIRVARTLGYRIKLIGVAGLENGALKQRVAPCLLPEESLIGALDGVTNAVVCDGAPIGQTAYVGPGAGEGPTASAIVADCLDVARGARRFAFGAPAATLRAAERMSLGAERSAYYIRLALVDRPGVLAQVTRCLGDDGVSIAEMRQLGPRPEPGSADPVAPVVMVTHQVTDSALRSAIGAISALDVCLAEPVALRIEAA